MLTKPVITHHEERPYVAIPARVNMRDIPSALPPLIPQVFAWLAQHNIAPAGAPFFLYLSIDQQNNLEARVGVPTAKPVTTKDDLLSAAFPAGNYLEITSTGSYDGLKEAHMVLEAWIREKGLKERCPATSNGAAWEGGRTESYVFGPESTQNPDDYRTDVFFLLE